MRRVWLITAVTFVVALVVDVVVGADTPGLGAVYGFAGCVVIIVASKWVGRVLLQREEEYYDRERDD